MAKTKQPEHPYDPRPDLVTDHKGWQEILLYCWHIDKDLYFLLHGLRCGGAGVTVTKGSFRLIQGQWSESEWEDIKTRLNPFRDKLISVFKIARVQLPLEFLSKESEEKKRE